MTLIEPGRLERLITEHDVTGAAIAIDQQTRFPVASLTKPVMAYAVLRLADAGLIDLDEPIARHLASMQPRFAQHSACPHDDGRPQPIPQPSVPDASWSLITTAADDGCFIQAAVLHGEGLAEATARSWIRLRIHAPRGEIVRLARAPEQLEPGLGWGLGGGVESGVNAAPESDANAVFPSGKITGIRSNHPSLRWVTHGVTE